MSFMLRESIFIYFMIADIIKFDMILFIILRLLRYKRIPTCPPERNLKLDKISAFSNLITKDFFFSKC